MDFKNLNLSDFIRYILTGFNVLLFVVAIPLIYIRPASIKDIISETSFLTMSLLSIAIGYLLDILKVYQFTPQFKSKRTQFRQDVANILEIPIEQSASYFSLVSKVWAKQSPYDLERRRSEWVLELQTSVTLMISTVVWIFAFFYTVSHNASILKLIIPVIAIILSIMGAIRLTKIAAVERERMNQDFILILKKNKEKILESWTLETDLDKEQKDEEHKPE